ncbi:class I adenylate-forming enzyme family protein [Streptomyces sp. NPDC058664]|uniref:class I adenylate-forming enzyme family protein n=1 Tax=unclassified Streptomyces TaxID=2593676 RepID=UPI00364AC32F
MIYERFLCHVAEHPDRTALRTSGGEVLTYRELADRAERVAAGLDRASVRAGDTVATWLDNTPGYVAAVLALCRIGAVHLPVGRQADADRIRTLLDRSGASLLVVGDGLPDVRRIPRTVRLDDLEVPAAAGGPAGRSPHSGVFRLQETSGSTGVPRLVAWRQEDLLADRLAWIEWTGLTPDDRVCCMHPLDVAHGSDVHLFPALLSGGELLLVESGATPDTVLGFLADHGATVFSALPRHYEQLVTASEARGGVRLPSLRLPLCGGAYLNGATVERAEETLGIRVRRIYGSTEFGIVLGNPDDVPQAGRGMRPLPGVEVRLEPLGASRPDQGELIARSAATSVGYHGDDEATARAFRDGWYRTGDVAERRPDGEYRVLGRTGDAIPAGDRALFAPVLEEELAARLPLDEVVVLAGGRSGLLVLAVPAPGADAAEAGAGVLAELAALGAGATVHVVDAIPHTPVGKADRPRIRRLFPDDPGPRA